MNSKKVLLTAALAGLCLGASCSKAPTATSVGECHGINKCAGKGECGSKGNGCRGLNNCKGQGWEKMTLEVCREKGGEFVKG